MSTATVAAPAPERPLPTPTRESHSFWDGMREGRFMLQHCTQCGKARHYPRDMAPFSAIEEPTAAAYADLAHDLEHFPLIMKHIRNCGSNWHIRRAERRRVDLRCGSTSLRPSARRLFGAAP